MSKQEDKGNSFPPLQKRIILNLAQSRPQTINETMKGISGHYKSSWIAFNVLEQKSLIRKATSKDYRGRQYPCFWLTDLGIFLALHQGAKPETLLKTTLEIYPEDKSLQFLIEAVPIIGKNALDVLYLTALNKGMIEQEDVTSILAAQMQKKFTPEQIRRFIAVLRKYPEIHQKCADSINQARKNLKELSNLL